MKRTGAAGLVVLAAVLPLAAAAAAKEPNESAPPVQAAAEPDPPKDAQQATADDFAPGELASPAEMSGENVMVWLQEHPQETYAGGRIDGDTVTMYLTGKPSPEFARILEANNIRIEPAQHNERELLSATKAISQVEGVYGAGQRADSTFGTVTVKIERSFNTSEMRARLTEIAGDIPLVFETVPDGGTGMDLSNRRAPR